MKMPIIDFQRLEGDARLFAEAITIDSKLRATKPDPKKTVFNTECVSYPGAAAYVWRMVAFMVSPNPKHHCMPCTAEFGIEMKTPEGRWDVRGIHAYTKDVLDPIVSKIVDAVDKREWHGVHRWGQAFGQIGTPRYNKEGAIIYR